VTTYLPHDPAPPGYEPPCVMVLVGRQIRLHYAGLWWYLDEDAMVWRDFYPHLGLAKDELP
jgi:hypothetical protein